MTSRDATYLQQLVSARQPAIDADRAVGEHRPDVVMRPHFDAIFNVDGALETDAQTAGLAELRQLRHLSTGSGHIAIILSLHHEAQEKI